MNECANEWYGDIKRRAEDRHGEFSYQGPAVWQNTEEQISFCTLHNQIVNKSLIYKDKSDQIGLIYFSDLIS